MDKIDWALLKDIGTYIAGFGGIISFIVGWKLRRAALRMKEAEADVTYAGAVEKMQNMYSKFILDYEKDREKLNSKITTMAGEIKKLQKIIQEQNERCQTCPNNKQR